MLWSSFWSFFKNHCDVLFSSMWSVLPQCIEHLASERWDYSISWIFFWSLNKWSVLPQCIEHLAPKRARRISATREVCRPCPQQQAAQIQDPLQEFAKGCHTKSFKASDIENENPKIVDQSCQDRIFMFHTFPNTQGKSEASLFFEVRRNFTDLIRRIQFSNFNYTKRIGCELLLCVSHWELTIKLKEISPSKPR